MTINLGEFESVKPLVRTRLLSDVHHDLSRVVKRHIASDLYATYYMSFDRFFEGTPTWTITTDMLEMWNISIDKLDAVASENEKDRHTITKISAELQAFMSEPVIDDEYPMFVVTNDAATYGASAVLSEDVQKKLSALLGDNYFVLPSSVHKTICLGHHLDKNELQTMVKQINESVTLADTLSDHVFEVRDGKFLCAV